MKQYPNNITDPHFFTAPVKYHIFISTINFRKITCFSGSMNFEETPKAITKSDEPEMSFGT